MHKDVRRSVFPPRHESTMEAISNHAGIGCFDLFRGFLIFEAANVQNGLNFIFLKDVIIKWQK
jgi:hypothetical protein